MTTGRFHSLLQCHVNTIEIDYRHRCVVIWLPPMNVTDMSGTVATCRAMYPDVRSIEVHSSDPRGRIVYQRTTDGQWQAKSEQRGYGRPCTIPEKS